MSLWRLVCAASAVAAAARETCAAGDCPASGPATGASLIAIRSAVTKRGLHANGLFGKVASMSIEGSEKETGLLSQVVALPFDAVPPRSFLEDLASMRGHPHLTALLNSTDSTITGLLGNVTGAASNDTKLRDRMLATFGDIATDFGKKKAMIQGLKDAAASAKTLHAECRANESSSYLEKETCDAEMNLLSKQAKDALLTVKAQQGAVALLCGNNAAGQGENTDDAYDPMKALSNASANFVKVKAEHKDKVGQCGGLTTSHGTKTAECDQKQRAFEGAVCHHFTSSETECELYQALYSSKVTDYKVVTDDIATREAERIIDFKHLKRVHCVVKALATHFNDKNTLIQSIELCFTKTFDTSGLVMQPKPAPSPETCPTSPAVVPCSGGFADQEYSALPKGVATATCENSCEVTTTTTTTTITATTTKALDTIFMSVASGPNSEVVCGCRLTAAGEVFCIGGEGDECQPVEHTPGPYTSLVGGGLSFAAVDPSGHVTKFRLKKWANVGISGKLEGQAWLKVDASWNYGSCGIRSSDRDVVCFGFSNREKMTGVFPGPWKIWASSDQGHCGVKADDNTLECFGDDWEGRKIPSTRDAPVGSAKDVKSYGYGFVGLMQDGSLHAWANVHGKIGLGVPTPAGSFSSFSVAYYGNVACALRTEDSMAVCWGRPTSMEGFEVPDEPLSSIYIQGKRVGLNGKACGLTLSDNELKCWGGGRGPTTFDELFSTPKAITPPFGAGWKSMGSWVDDFAGANDHHSEWGFRQPPSNAMDSTTTTHAGFVGTSGFMVMDLSIPLTVTRFRLRNDGNSADAKSTELHSASAISGPWTSLATLSLTTESSWQESASFAASARFFKLSWSDNHGLSGATRIVDVQLFFPQA